LGFHPDSCILSQIHFMSLVRVIAPSSPAVRPVKNTNAFFRPFNEGAKLRFICEAGARVCSLLESPQFISHQPYATYATYEHERLLILLPAHHHRFPGCSCLYQAVLVRKRRGSLTARYLAIWTDRCIGLGLDRIHASYPKRIHCCLLGSKAKLPTSQPRRDNLCNLNSQAKLAQVVKE
jgi:hypothetical protein